MPTLTLNDCPTCTALLDDNGDCPECGWYPGRETAPLSETDLALMFIDLEEV